MGVERREDLRGLRVSRDPTVVPILTDQLQRHSPRLDLGVSVRPWVVGHSVDGKRIIPPPGTRHTEVDGWMGVTTVGREWL